MTARLTSKDYAKEGGGRCPFCLSEDIEGGPVEIDGNGASQEIGCNECDAEWWDTYVLTGYEAKY